MRLGHSLPAALLVAVLALVGCEDPVGPDVTSATPSGEPAGEHGGEQGGEHGGEHGGEQGGEHAGESPSGSPTNLPSDTPTSPSDTPASQATELPRSRVRAAVLHTAVLGNSAATTAEEKAVVEAWMGYWQSATNTYYYKRPPRALTRYAADSALRAVEDTLADLRSRRERVVGWSRDNVTSVTVDDDRATLRDCTENFTFNVDEEGSPLTKPTPWYDVTGVLEKREGRWVVVRADSRKLTASCLR